jgi:ribosomal protein S10
VTVGPIPLAALNIEWCTINLADSDQKTGTAEEWHMRALAFLCY